MSEKLEEYKVAFESYIVEYCKNYNTGLYDAKDLEWFKTLANNEYEAQLESVGIDDMSYDNPELDAEECISYWE